MTNFNQISFSNCLKELLDATGVKCRALAIMLNFEYSTVYKWKGGQRIPPLKNYKEIINDIAEVFVKVALEDDICNRRVLAIITKYGKGVSEQSKGDQDINESKLYKLQHISSILIDAYQYSKSFIECGRDNDNSNGEQTNRKEKIQEGSMCSGIREVAMQYTELIKRSTESNSDRSTPIIYFNLVNRIDLSLGNTEGSYVKSIQGLIDHGWKINITMCIDKYKHNSMDVSNTVTNFFPMVSKDSFSMDYIYMDTSRRQIDSVFIVPGVGAIITYSLADWDGNEFCCVINDVKSVELLYRYYQKRLESVRAMYSFHSFEWYLKTMRYSHQAGEDNMVVTSNVGFAMMPKEELAHFVKTVLADKFTDEQDMCNHVNDTVKFYDTISGNSYQHIMSKSEFSDYIRNGQNNIMGYKCNIGIEQRIRHLEHILNIVDGNTSIELLLLDDIEFENIKGMTLNLNSSNKALLNILDEGSLEDVEASHGFIMLTEPFVVNGLKAKFKRIWQNTSNSILIKRGSTEWLRAKINWLMEVKVD